MFGGSELMIIIIIAAVLFGGTAMANKLGRAKKEFEKGKLEGEKELEEMRGEIEEEEE